MAAAQHNARASNDVSPAPFHLFRLAFIRRVIKMARIYFRLRLAAAELSLPTRNRPRREHAAPPGWPPADHLLTAYSYGPRPLRRLAGHLFLGCAPASFSLSSSPSPLASRPHRSPSNIARPIQYEHLRTHPPAHPEIASPRRPLLTIKTSHDSLHNRRHACQRRT